MDLLTSEEAAEQLGLSARRVRILIAQGDLAAVKVGRTRLVSPESVARLRRARAAGRSLSARTSWVVLLSNLGSTDFAPAVPHRQAEAELATFRLCVSRRVAALAKQVQLVLGHRALQSEQQAIVHLPGHTRRRDQR